MRVISQETDKDRAMWAHLKGEPSSMEHMEAEQAVSLYKKHGSVQKVSHEMGIPKEWVKLHLDAAYRNRTLRPKPTREEVVASYKKNGDVKKVARELDISHASAYNHLIRAGAITPTRKRGMRETIVDEYHRLHSPSMVAKHLGLSHDSVKAQLRLARKNDPSIPRYKEKTTDKDVRDAVERHISIRTAARELGISHPSLLNRLRRKK